MGKRSALVNEAVRWRKAAERANTGTPIGLITTTRAMRARHFDHSYYTVHRTRQSFTNLSRSLACLFLALACMEEAQEASDVE